MSDPEMLDQSDVDTLMDAVESGDLRDEQRPARIFSRFRRDHEKVEIRVYDFKRPERIGKGQMRTLRTLHEAFARGFGAQMSGFIRSIVEVRVASAEQMTYAEFIGSLPNPTCFTLLDCPPLGGQICMDISPLVVFPLVERLLGGTNQSLLVPKRPLTGIESRLMRQVLDLGMNALTEAWSGVKQIDFGISAMESNPQLVEIVPPNEVVVMIGFEIRLGSRVGDGVGTMSLCIPYNVIEPVMEDLSTENWFVAGEGGTRGAEQAIISRLHGSTVQVEATLAETSMTLADLGRLEVGDLITTDRRADQPVAVSIAGRPKFEATLGQHRGKRALRIVDTANSGKSTDVAVDLAS
ncbi:MAG: flagellar motor switch protein FliM [Planctomycetota bacterium]|jgi:flagellar motor switch protein FliM